MATLNYIVKGKKYYSNILVRFKDGTRNDLTASTEIKVDPKKWSSTRQRIKQIAGDTSKDEINVQLGKLEEFILNQFNNDHMKGVFIDTNWLKKKIAKFFNRPIDDLAIDQIYFVPYVQGFIKIAPTRLVKGKNQPVSQGTIKKYKSTLVKLQDYERKYKTKIRFTDLDLHFYDKFVNMLSVEQKINMGTVGHYIKTVKTMAREAKLLGLPVHEHINHPKFFGPTSQALSIYLKDDEINTIFSHNFKLNERLDNARDLFIIGLRTGLRISDFLRLKETNIKEGFIEIETQKTGQTVVIPMHPQVKEILEKRNGFPESISDQKFNLYIKEVCQEAKLNAMTEGSKINPKTNRKEKGIYPKYELVTSHICRRSFASNLYGKLPNLVIMGITGHQTEAQFLKYIKITPKENAKKLQEFWQKQLEENQVEKLNMKVVK
ncbi:tyrosine-type recombinase/integrase [Namhaeicola litoreus]|uniref:Tyrosine-type recombinase/integrase n=1 Tax=Namhaeicola litoreus TaxID=1052145 RepID=A0ABW3Y349_9FLAO